MATKLDRRTFLKDSLVASAAVGGLATVAGFAAGNTQPALADETGAPDAIVETVDTEILVIGAGCGGLAFVRNQGFFDIMSYGIKTVFHIHLPWTAPRTPEEGKESFVEYKERKR